MRDYEFRGPKDGKYEAYQTLNYVEKNIEGIEPTEVDEFNMTAGRLFRWLKLALENRKFDIIRRRALIQKERDERESKIKLKEEREAKRATDLEAAKTKFQEDHKDEIEAYEAYRLKLEEGGDEYNDEEDDEQNEETNKEPVTLPEFDEAEFFEEWDQENPDIIIAEGTEDDVDNDWVLSEEDAAEEIKKFWANKGEQ
mmetsp:Transcript_28748/g.43419  ORF Transcript_28748/g.43419 Transcript_28748/m.43419 type:complete len:198 (-) Transcript_28748:7-600(-)